MWTTHHIGAHLDTQAQIVDQTEFFRVPSLSLLLPYSHTLTYNLSLFLSLTVQLAIKRADIFTTLFYLSLSHFCLFENGVSLFHFPTYRYLLLFLYISISHNLMSIYPTHSPPLSFIQNPLSTYQPIRPYSHVGHFSIMRHLNLEILWVGTSETI